MTRREKRHLDALRKRLDWLERRISDQTDKHDHSFDRQEASALRWALERLDEMVGPLEMHPAETAQHSAGVGMAQQQHH